VDNIGYGKIVSECVFFTAITAAGFCYCAVPGPVFAQDQVSKIDVRVGMPVCGNGIRENDEQCDGADMAGKNCQTLGFSRGVLSCKPSCELNVAGCSRTQSSSGSSAGSVPAQIINNAAAVAKLVASGVLAKGDLNSDGKVNLVDFSIAAYWYGRVFLPAAKASDLNSDGKVDLADFSIMAYYWSE